MRYKISAECFIDVDVVADKKFIKNQTKKVRLFKRLLSALVNENGNKADKLFEKIYNLDENGKMHVKITKKRLNQNSTDTTILGVNDGYGREV